MRGQSGGELGSSGSEIADHCSNTKRHLSQLGRSKNKQRQEISNTARLNSMVVY